MHGVATCGRLHYGGAGRGGQPNTHYIPEPGEVVEGFDVIDEIDLDLEDKLVPLAIEVLVLSCI